MVNAQTAAKVLRIRLPTPHKKKNAPSKSSIQMNSGFLWKKPNTRVKAATTKQTQKPCRVT